MTLVASVASPLFVERTVDVARRFERESRTAGRPASTSSTSCARRSASSPGARRSDRRMTGDAEQAHRQQPDGDDRLRRSAGSTPASMHACSCSTRCALHLAREREALVLPADARHRAVDEHQREVLRLLAAELVQAPENRPHALERLERRRARSRPARRRVAEQPEAFLREREEDVVLAGKVAVDGGGAVLDALGDLADRDVAESLR